MARSVRPSEPPSAQPTPRRRRTTADEDGPDPRIYVDPIAPLGSAQHSDISGLDHTHKTEKLAKHLKDAQDWLKDTLVELNELAVERERIQEETRERRRNKGQEPLVEDEKRLKALKENVKRVTKSGNESFKEVLDEQARFGWIKGALNEVNRNATSGADGAVHTFKRRIGRENDTYEDEEPMQKYARNDETPYHEFRAAVHTAMYTAGEAPPIRPARWFSDDANTDAADSDEDVRIEREKRSIKCPLTLLPFTDPVTSDKCPHSFERSAITEMLMSATIHVGGPGGRVAAIKCPCCSVELSATNLKSNPELLRTVQRVLKQNRRQQELDDADEESEEDQVGRSTQPTTPSRIERAKRESSAGR